MIENHGSNDIDSLNLVNLCATHFFLINMYRNMTNPVSGSHLNTLDGIPACYVLSHSPQMAHESHLDPETIHFGCGMQGVVHSSTHLGDIPP